MACEVFEPCEWWRAFGFLLAELRAEEFDFVFELLPRAFLGWGLRVRGFLWEWSFNGFPQNGFLAKRDFVVILPGVWGWRGARIEAQ